MAFTSFRWMGAAALASVLGVVAAQAGAAERGSTPVKNPDLSVPPVFKLGSSGRVRLTSDSEPAAIAAGATAQAPSRRCVSACRPSA